MKTLDLESTLTFGYEQTFTTPQWWSDEGFTATSDTPLKREKMLLLAQEIAKELNGSFKESVDIWDHMQYETFHKDGKPSFVVTMDPGSIEVKTQPCLARDAEEMASPLFAAAERAGVVPYRNWWYGVKSGTEGGCHVNMGGFSNETNPLKQRPDLAVKYCAYIHNRPWLHYPFMGIDVGPEGNAMRMDEKEGFQKVKDAFKAYKVEMSADEVYRHFEKTNLISDKASFPSLFKLKDPLYFIEDRAQEALRAPEEFRMVAQTRLKIMSALMEQEKPEELQTIKDLHGEVLTSHWLWEKFQKWAEELGVSAAPYKRFFERQFPELHSGEGAPTSFWINEGRRPRVVTDIVKRGDTIVSKKIDTSYKRFEICAPSDIDSSFEIHGEGIESISTIFKTKNVRYCYVDIKIDQKSPVLEISLNDERARFNMNDMMWTKS